MSIGYDTSKYVSISQAIGAVVLILGTVWWCEDHKAKEREQEQLQASAKAKAIARLAHPDPLMRLAGCMANNASTTAQKAVSGVIFRRYSGTKVEPSELADYEEARNALLERCWRDHREHVEQKYKTVTVDQLNTAFIAVLEDDSEVAGWVSRRLDALKAAKDKYIR